MLNNKQNYSGANIEIIDFKELSNKNEEVDSIFVEVYRSDIERGHIQRYLKLFSTLEKKKIPLANKIIFVFKGYETDSREPFEIKEVRKWVRRLFKNKPHIFYYLCDYSETILTIFLCLSEVKVINSKFGRTTSQIQFDVNLLYKLLTAALIHSEKRKDNEEVQNNVGLVIAKAIYERNTVEYTGGN